MGNTEVHSNRPSTATLLIGLGVIFLIGQIIDFSAFLDFHWAYWIMIPGVLMFAAAARGDSKTAGLAVPASIVTGTGLILLFQDTMGYYESWAYVWALYPFFAGAGILLMGNRTGNQKSIETGNNLIRIGLLTFAVFAGFFELFIFHGIPSLGRFALPLLLIGAGALLLTRRGQTETEEPAKMKPVYLEKPKRSNDPASIINPDLQRRIDEAINEE